MKKTLIYVLGLLAAVTACKHTEIVVPIDFNVTLDKENTFLVGEPVKFNISGNAENILFYSGEQGHNYDYRLRTEVPMEDVLSADLTLEVQARYGNAGALKVYVSNTFTGLNGADGFADREAIAAMIDGGMQGWTELDYQEGASTKWTSQTFAMSDYLENFSIALHWKPITNTAVQRTYWINGELSIDMKGTDPATMKLNELSLVSVMMNEEIEDPYKRDGGNGTIQFKSTAAQIVCQGVAANVLPYILDGWIISQPTKLNKVTPDTPAVIKDIQNYLTEFEHTFEKAGTYEVVFVGTNANYLGSSSEVRRMKVIVIDKI